MTLLLQISDPHFGTERAAVIDALVALAHAVKPDLAVWSGDITQRAYRRQFDGGRRLADRLQVPHTLAIPGNHDLPLLDPLARCRSPYRNFQRAFGDDLEPSFVCEDMLVIGVNTTRPWRHKHGEVSGDQIEHVAARLQAARPQQLRVLVLHHPVLVIQAQDRVDLLRGHREAVARWARAGADLILGGHIHLPYVRELDLATATSRRVWAVQAGTALSSRVRSGFPNSVNLIRYAATDAQSACVERWDYDARSAGFRTVQQTEIQRSGPAGPAQ
jgi:3',5'-cyclic AMP phosphodiesterase CpdA